MYIPKQLFLTAAMFAGATAFATDYYVAVGGTGDYTAGNPGPSPVAAAKLATQSGDVIHVGVGTYEMAETTAVKPGVTLIGGTDNPEDTVLVRIGTGKFDRATYLGRKGVLRNLTVRGGYTDYQGACVLGFDTSVHTDFIVSNCVVEGGSSLYKGGASMGGGLVQLDHPQQ